MLIADLAHKDDSLLLVGELRIFAQLLMFFDIVDDPAGLLRRISRLLLVLLIRLVVFQVYNCLLLYLGEFREGRFVAKAHIRNRQVA